VPLVALPIVFGPTGRLLSGFYHPPKQLPSRAVAVVLCNPLGYEAMSVHRTYRHLAEGLASRGLPALRFDYDGTGDSSGRSDDPGRVRAWIESVGAAVAEIRRRAGEGPVALLGMRFGAMLAALAAAEDGDIDSLVSWAPVVSGRVHACELRAFRLLTERKARVPPRSDGGVEVGGHIFSKETLDAMSTFDSLAGSVRPAKRVLVLPGAGHSNENARLVAHFQALGADARLATATGYAGMMRDDSYESVVPLEALDAVVSWLSEANHPESRAPSPAMASSNCIVIPAHEGKGAVRETPLLFGEGARLFGVLSEPERPDQQDRPALCFLNVGANHHVGPHRMNVELARELASRGYLSLRFDAAGLGDSHATQGMRENRIYTKDSIADVKSAMSLLGQMRDKSRFVLVGLCSGAYLAYHTTLEDSRVVGQVLLSPYAFEWEEGDPVSPKVRRPVQSMRFYARALLERRTWLRTMRGEIDVREIARVFQQRVHEFVDAELPSWSARLRGRRRPQNEVERAFGVICDREVKSLMVLSFDDGGVDMIARYLGNDARRMRGRKNFTFKIVEGGDHTFKAVASQKMLRDLVTSHVTTHFP
jgi:alpha-beta hydrolase superfamily lysophospholipase